MVRRRSARLVGQRAAGVVGASAGPEAVNGGSQPLIYVEPRRLIDEKAATADTRRCPD
jgi:hypothetical protein